MFEVGLPGGPDRRATLLQPLRLGSAPQESPAQLPLHVLGDPVNCHQIMEESEGRTHLNLSMSDGRDHRVQVPRFDRPPALKNQTCQRQYVILGEPVEEILVLIQCEMS